MECRRSEETEDSRGIPPRRDGDFERRVEGLLKDLLAERNRAKLEQYRAYRGTNRLYKVPLDDHDFVVVKLLPGRWQAARARVKWHLRNLAYGERGVSIGSRPVQMEKARYKQWAHSGLRTPRLIETSLPDVRVVQGLALPTFSELLGSHHEPLVEKLQALASVTKSLSHQHRTAFDLGQNGLVHSDPGPPNILFDRQNGLTYWLDLEYPDDCPGMTLHDLAVRALRIFIYSVLDRLDDGGDEAIRVIAANYRLKSVLRGAADSMEKRTFLFRAVMALGIKRQAYERHRRIGRQIKAVAADAGAS